MTSTRVPSRAPVVTALRLDRRRVVLDEDGRLAVDADDGLARQEEHGGGRRLRVDLREDRLARPQRAVDVLDDDAHVAAARLAVDDVADVRDLALEDDG